MSHTLLKRAITFLAMPNLYEIAKGHETDPEGRGSGFRYDYCSMGLQVEVYNDA